ncbi:MAG TPA: glucosamine-6-phosphate deaminase [Candidatus Limnocylindria bacterium]|nr:glucosamine-6-phosphate deaminase [Candidatus Limnocylindria bacterium]
MNVHVFASEAQAARAAASLFAAQLLRKPASVLGLATGSTPVSVYAELARMHEDGVLDFSRAVSFNLDEYVGLPKDHPQSYHSFMHRSLFSRVNLQASFLPDGEAEDLPAECRRYDEAIARSGGIDLQLLGIGSNGHIGFNEPAREFAFGTNLVDLAQDTIEANKRFFYSAADVPRRALSMGVGTIMQARGIVLLALGEEKAQAVKAMAEGPVTPRVPASILRFHQDATVLLDRGAAKLLTR